MKIRELRFKNLNSLYGEWSIDFTEPAYETNGIFAITGPTGAGKSTVLDAICLALYGETPRLGKITKGGNEIMSRRTGECFAEVTFEGAGGVFRCHWSQHRAHKSALGSLAESKHEIADALSGKILESKKRETILAVAARTGMDFSQFTRSILLAQGSFDSFLRSGSDSRSPILEQITGTEIYSRISIEVHERLRREQIEQEKLASEISGVVLLNDEEVNLLDENLLRLEEEEKKKGEEWAVLNVIIQWLENRDQLEAQLKSLELEKSGLEEKEKLFSSQGERLLKAGLASELEGLYATLSAGRMQVEKERTDLDQERKELSRAEREQGELDLQLNQSLKQLVHLRQKGESEKEVFNEIRNLDRQAAVLKNNRTGLEEERDTLQQKCLGFLKEKETLVKQRESFMQQRMALEISVETSRKKLPPFGDLGVVSQMIDQLEQLKNEITEKKISLLRVQEDAKSHNLLTTKSLKERELALIDLEHLKGERESLIEEMNKDLSNRPLGEIRREKEGLLREQALINRINDLEDERSRLEEGKPCPLCGSEHHPFTKGLPPGQNKWEAQISELSLLIERTERREGQLAELADQIAGVREVLVKIDASLSELKSNEAHGRARIESLSSDIEEFSRRSEKQEKELLLKLSPLKLKSLPLPLIPFLNGLKEQQKKLLENEEELKGLIKRIEEITSPIQRSQTLMESHTSLLEEKKISCSRLNRELEDILAQRRGIGGEKNPDREEESLNRIILGQEESAQKLRLAKEALVSRIKERQLYIKQREENLIKGEKERKQRQEEFSLSLQEKGFSGEEDFLACRLSASEREDLLARGEELKKKRIDWDTRMREKTESLKKERDRNLTSESHDILCRRRTETGDILKALGRDLGSGKEQLERDRLMRARLKDKQQILEKQRLEYQKWDNLHSLIGSADGKKYRNFAQGITFELMVGRANQQLVKMTDRYLLLRDDTSPLELNVIDNYQAGEIRSTRNLSGGEGFIVSLSLALGLSQMASQKVRVDSLFLDEGFGTLDEEALDMALETLASLHQEGKLIGVISHLPALKERIGCQLNLQPLTGGKSALSGPGVEKRKDSV